MDNNVLRLIPCPECDGSGFMFHYNDPTLIGLPPACPCCQYHGYLSYEELQAWRNKQDKEWENSPFAKYIKSKHFQEVMDKIIEDSIKETIDEI